MNLGQQNGRLVACRASAHHGFHPEAEACPYCPRLVKAAPTRTVDWYVDVQDGEVRQLAFPVPGFILLDDVKANTVEAKRICGCSTSPGVHRYFRSGWGHTTVCDGPQVVKDPRWTELP
jgi:hypothetical protein